MQIFNADGSTAPACGNGARCLAALAVHTGRAPADGVVRVVSPALIIDHRMVDRTAWRLAQRMELPADPVVWSDGTNAQVILGTHHRILFTSLAEVDLTAAGPAAERCWPGGTNVMFAEVVAADLIDVLPWERGVGRTLGCATGAAAAAIVAGRNANTGSGSCTVRQPGGAIHVEWGNHKLTMEGSVRFISEGTVNTG
jgi:diaminopimelate epimerase